MIFQDGNIELWRCVFETSPDAIMVVDVETQQIIASNPSATALFGCDCEDLVGMRLEELSAEPADTLVAFCAGVERIAERRFRRKDGSEFPAEVRIHTTIMGGREVRVGHLCSLEERERCAKALHFAHAKFEVAFRASPDAININRRSDGQYLDVNEGFCALTGYSREDVEGKTSLEVGIWADPRDRERLVEGIDEHGGVDELQAVFRRKDGSTTVAVMSARCIDLDGVPCVLSVTHDISERLKVAEELENTNKQLADMVRQVAEALGRVVELRDPYTAGHQERVAELAVRIARTMGLDADEIASVELAAFMHDVGKMSVPAEILNRPGALTEVEKGLIRVHPEQGYQILKDIHLPWPTAQIVREHHERFDGSGYPLGTRGTDIMLAARIIAVADVVEAMASHRPYRPALGIEFAMSDLLSVPDRYDPDVLAATVTLHEQGELGFLVS